jgi:hypothetical protein
VSLCRDGRTRRCVTAALVTFHVTPYAESFSTTGLRTLVRFLSGVAVTVDS